MKVQGRLIQARFIEIHQVVEKKMSDTFLTSGTWVVTINDWSEMKHVSRVTPQGCLVTLKAKTSDLKPSYARPTHSSD